MESSLNCCVTAPLIPVNILVLTISLIKETGVNLVFSQTVDSFKIILCTGVAFHGAFCLVQGLGAVLACSDQNVFVCHIQQW